MLMCFLETGSPIGNTVAMGASRRTTALPTAHGGSGEGTASAEISPVLSWAWEQQRIWSRTSDRLKKQLDLLRAASLLLGIVAAVLAVAATLVMGDRPVLGRSLGAATAISAGLATLVQRGVTTDRIRSWTRARSVSEALKTEVYSYLAGGTRYTERDQRDRTLYKRSRDLVNKVEGLLGLTVAVDPDDKPVPAVTSIDDYITHRVEQQIEGYYRPRAAIYLRRVWWLRATASALGAVAVVLSAVATWFELPPVSAWVPVATTIGTAVVAHIAASRYDHLIIEFQRTAYRLELLRQARSCEPGDDATFVDDCEDAISVENQGWMARWNDD